MATWTLDYPLTADLLPVGGSALSGTGLVRAGLVYGDVFEAKFLHQANTSTITATRYVQATITPGVDVEEYTLGSIQVTSGRRGGSSITGWDLRSSVDGYVASLASRTDGTSLVTTTVDLSGLGVLTGPVTLRFLVRSSSGSVNGGWLTDWKIAGDYVPAGATDQSVSPSSIASTLLVGTPTLVATPPLVLEPAGIASTVVLGQPSVRSVLPQVVRPAGIASTALVGSPAFGVLDPVLWVPAPTGDDLEVLLGATLGAGQADGVVELITGLVRSHTRGRGFESVLVRAGIRDVILAASARLAGNPDQTMKQVGNVSTSSMFMGWTLPERTVLNQYRGVSR